MSTSDCIICKKKCEDEKFCTPQLRRNGIRPVTQQSKHDDLILEKIMRPITAPILINFVCSHLSIHGIQPNLNNQCKAKRRTSGEEVNLTSHSDRYSWIACRLHMNWKSFFQPTKRLKKIQDDHCRWVSFPKLTLEWKSLADNPNAAATFLCNRQNIQLYYTRFSIAVAQKTNLPVKQKG